MLVGFSVKNFRSIKDEVFLSMEACRTKDKVNNSVVVSLVDKQKPINLLTSVAIFGANATGKTNLIKALIIMKRLVMTSHQEVNHLPYEPFLLSKDSLTEPTEFGIVILIDGIEYSYGFSFDAKQMYNEWLYMGRKKIFVRSLDENKAKFVYFDKLITGTKQVWKQNTRPDALFLSVAVSLNSEQLKPVFDWFKNKLQVYSSNNANISFTTENYILDQEKKSRLLQFMQAADFEIKDIYALSDEVESVAGDKSFFVISKSSFLNANEYNVNLIHATDYNDGVSFDLLKQESSGTLQMYKIAGFWLNALENGAVLLFDELNANLHPLLVKFLINCFHNKEYNKYNAQLVFTTHETSILDQRFLSRDQIWFCKRNNNQSTQLVSLIEYKTRPDILSIEKAYLSGRYDAIPAVKDLVW